MKNLTLVLSNRFALATLLSMSKSVDSMPVGATQFLNIFEASIANNFENYFDELGDQNKLNNTIENIKTDPRFVIRFKEILSNPVYIRQLIDEDLTGNIESGALSLAISDEPKVGDFCVAASMKFAVSMISLRLSQPNVGESLRDWTRLARERGRVP